jgi:hypothetical protein
VVAGVIVADRLAAARRDEPAPATR